ncbi:MAG: uracil-DNA glycosylase [Verrucomicrobiales bacterium]|nr:uracil-DNA glycosylase [Verrucomicrobiales bacterium]
MLEEHPISGALHALQGILEREKSRGQTHVALQSESESILEALPVRLMERAQKLKAVDCPVPPETVSSSKGEPDALAAVLASKPPRERTEEWARNELNRIFREVKSCETCRSLGTFRETIVFATGNPLADIMFIGHAPGAEDEKERKPFVGPAGEKLTQIIKAMGLSREEVYLSNIVKFRPKKGDGRFQGSSNRKPNATEMESCLRFIKAEVEVVAPKVIVALGPTAAEGLLERGGSISSLREQAHEFAGAPVVVSYHPSFLLRQENEPDQARAKASKRKVWEDMLKAMDLAGLPISEKQRGFFA